MKTVFAALLCATVFPLSATAQPAKTGPGKKGPKEPAKKKPAPLPFKTQVENISFAIGYNLGRTVHARVLSPRGALGRIPVKVDGKKLAAAMSIDKEFYKNLRKEGLTIDEKRFREGFDSAFSGGKPKLSVAQLREVFATIQKVMKDAQKKKNAARKKKNAAFLAKHKARKGVTTTKTGLQYEVLKAGKGKSPKKGDQVVVHYKGTLLDGTEFDSSHKRGMPAEFQVGQVIKGWNEALSLMKKGAKWKLVIPPDLAYGASGTRDGSIGPDEVLIFEVELIDIKDAPKSPPKRRG